MWDFNHEPANSVLATRYDIHVTSPAACADDLLSGRAGLGLIPVAALTPELAIVPGCTIAALDHVRSIQLIVKAPHTLGTVRTIAADTASRSSLAYAQILFHRFLGHDPAFIPCPADPVAMLHVADAALLIGDPALLALERRAEIEEAVGPCLWLDLAHEWHIRTGMPWVAAVWAARPDALHTANLLPAQLTADLQHSRDGGLQNIDALVDEWTPRIALPPATIRSYFTSNIHYTLTPECIRAIELFRAYSAEAGILPPLSSLRFLV